MTTLAVIRTAPGGADPMILMERRSDRQTQMLHVEACGYPAGEMFATKARAREAPDAQDGIVALFETCAPNWRGH